MAYQVMEYNDLRVHYLPELNGGGLTFGQQYVDFLHDNVGPVERLFEWCCGPAFIGFSLLAHGLCEELYLADVNPLAVSAVEATVEANGLAGKVHYYESDNLRDLPGISWDLVIGNPPHSGTDRLYPAIGKPSIIYMDAEWSLHRSFYSEVVSHLRPGGKVIIQENGKFSSADDFAEMIKTAGLEIKRVDDGGRGYYFLWSEPAGVATERRTA